MALPSGTSGNKEITFGDLADNNSSASRSDIRIKTYSTIYASGSAVGDVDKNGTANQVADRDQLNAAPYQIVEFYGAEASNTFFGSVTAQTSTGTSVMSNGYIDSESGRIAFTRT